MSACTHCNGRSFRYVFNVFMGSFGLTRCHVCGQVFGVKKRVRWLVKLSCYIIGFFALFAALTLDSAWPLMVYAVLILQLLIFALFRIDLIELDDKEQGLSSLKKRHSDHY